MRKMMQFMTNQNLVSWERMPKSLGTNMHKHTDVSMTRACRKLTLHVQNYIQKIHMHDKLYKRQLQIYAFQEGLPLGAPPPTRRSRGGGIEKAMRRRP